MSSSPHAHHQARGFTPEALEHIRQRYEETNENQRSIAADFNITYDSLRRLAKKQNWQVRSERKPLDLPDALRLKIAAERALAATDAVTPALDAPSADDAADAIVDRSCDLSNEAPLAARLEAAVERELRKVEALRGEYGNGAARTADAERSARTLATLTETLFKLRRLGDADALSTEAGHDELPADIDDFRHILAQRINAFVRSRADASVAGAGEPAEPGAPR